MSEVLRGLLDLALPPICAGCARPVASEAALCCSCSRAFPPPPDERPPLLPSGVGCTAAVAYEAGSVEWVRRFKFPRPGISGLDGTAGAVLRAWIEAAGRSAPGPRPDLVIPVALHPRRTRTRGFNPAALLARSLAVAIGVPHDPVALTRTRDTASQAGLDRRARMRNVGGAFRVRERLPAVVRVWLVDDVVTTGSTVAACAAALQRYGVRDISVVCAARTPLDSDARASPLELQSTAAGGFSRSVS